MLITFSSRILARFQTGPPEILAAGKILTARNFDSRRKSRQHSHRDIRLPAKNPGKTPAGIPPRFWPPGSRFPPRIPARFPPGSRRDFGRRESRLPAKNPGKNPGGNRESRRPKSRRDPGGNLGGILARSRQDPGTIFTRDGDVPCTGLVKLKENFS